MRRDLSNKIHALWLLRLFGLALRGALVAQLGCSSVAVWAAPEKAAKVDRSARAQAANRQFWDALHAGEYDAISDVLNALTAAYLENPNDPQTTAHIGFAHIWRVSESARLASPPPTITDDLVVSRKYFTEAVQLSPNDQRFEGFRAALELAEGTLDHDEKRLRHGYFALLDAKDAWPEFNLFTAGYSLSRLPESDPKYRDALDYQWQTLDLCAGTQVDHEHPDYARFMGLETTVGRKRACWNSWIAPHNFEGFFLNMGDMLVKSGAPKSARQIYQNAKLSKTYATWPYRAVLEQRMADAESNVEPFRHAQPGEKTKTLMVYSAFACAGCHQR
jgi:hypothetical protein